MVCCFPVTAWDGVSIIGDQVPVFVISHDVFYSAGSLLRFAEMSDAVTSAGLTNPVANSCGVAPIKFSLPKSKLLIFMSGSVDISAGDSPWRVMNIDVEREVDMTLNEWINYLNSETADPFMRKIRDILSTD
ncbi:MAG: hypothetical protein AB7F40_02930 [Victivallaceae bacterium]|nr:hypothetical protein [Victivallaceae bacterium]